MSGLILLDRDGVINEDRGDYVKSPEEWVPIPGSVEAIARLTEAGWDVVVVTNQSAIARGLIDEATLSAIHAKLVEAVEGLGGRVAAILHCPHHPREGCACRKPEPGLIRQAEARLGVSALGAPLVGDKLSDLEAARRAGCRPILVQTGYGEDVARQAPGLEDVATFLDLREAVEALLDESHR